ncbi:MAG TPA: hypothetical protein K8U90_07145 [Akkermansia muciniphila]|nr:hypothetical protein [Akkermansia muciniphila]
MAALLEPMPFWQALSYLEGKEAVASAMTTAEWQRMPVAVRVKSLFSATLTSAKAAQEITDYLTGFVRGEKAVNDKGKEYHVYQGRAEFVANMRERMLEEGFGKVLHDGTLDPEIHDNDLRDLRGCRRLQLIFDTQTEQAASFAQWQEGQDPDVLDVYPCQRFIRVRPVHTPRPYHDDAIGEVRRKDDLAFWIGLNRDFRLPWGPWGFNSGCGVEDVDRDESEALGVIKPTDKVRSIKKDFLDGLEESVRGLDDKTRRWIQAQMENRVRFLGDTAVYQPDKPRPAAPASVPSRPAKTPAQIDAQKKRIADTIAARQQREAADRGQIARRLWQDFKQRKEAELAPLRDRLKNEAAAYMQARTPENRIAWIAADDAFRKALESWEPGGTLYKATVKAINREEEQSWSRTYRDSMRFLGLDGMIIPQDKRGTVAVSQVKMDARYNITPARPKKLSPNVQQGLDLVRAIVAADKLPPSLGVHVLKDSSARAFQLHGNIKVSSTTPPSTVAHELAHAIEHARPDILRQSAAFLYDRGRGEQPKRLKSLFPTHNYRPQEITLEDKWAEKGGHAYTGKIYCPGYDASISREQFISSVRGSEILSMGIQRMLESPVDFQRQDPEFYNFIKAQLS